MPDQPTRDRALHAAEQALTPVLRSYGVALFDLSMRREKSGWVLRVVVERPEGKDPGAGITVDLCADISRDVSAALDVADPFSHPYMLEVSSPGVERPLRDAGEYARFEGKVAKLVLERATPNGQLGLRGKLMGVVEGCVQIETEGGAETVALADIKSGQLVFEPPGQPKKANNPKKKRRPSKGR